MPDALKTLITIATFNEIENLPILIEGIQRELPQADILVIDDSSPDGTGAWAEQRSHQDARMRVLHRGSKQGLGTAITAGLRYAVEHGYDQVINMDADLSHDPKHLPALLEGMEPPGGQQRDVMIGSRYVRGGATEGWPVHRQLASRAINLYARILLGLPPRDCSGAYRCYRVSRLAELDFSAVLSRGYCFQQEILWRLKRLRCRFGETPIVFRDRRYGQTKINSSEVRQAVWLIFRLGCRNWLGL